ncbi:MAG: helix-turn-helix domain-containing protein [Eubacterium sp.]
MDNLEFANRIIELRKQKGLSQKELGDMLGVSNKAVSKWENGESMPKTATMLKLAELLGIDGNELIGFEVRESDESKYSEDEISKLKSENAILSSRLNAIDKRRKRSFIAVIIICIVSVIASGIIAICFNSDNSVNADINDAGKKGTKIVFSEETFVVPDELESFVIKDHDKYEYVFGDTKYAEFRDLKNNKQKVLIECDSTVNFVKLTVGKKEYYYVKEGLLKIEMLSYQIDGIYLNNSSIVNNDYDIYDYYDDYFYDYDKYFSNEFPDEADAIKAFCDFYQNKKNPVDKAITQRFLGNKPEMVILDFSIAVDEDYDVSEKEIGEFFKDDDGKVYFYDYVTTSSYSVGKELSGYVY